MTLPDNRSPLASSNLESSSTTYPHPGTAYSKPALPRRVSEFTAMNGVTFRWYHNPAGFSSHLPSKTRFSLVQPLHGPPHKATRATIPRTGRRGSKSMIPYSIKSSADVQVEILSDDKLKSRRKKASGATLRTSCLSQPCLTVGDNQSSLTPFFC